MSSQTDLDQGGTFREWARQYLGPSIGWIDAPITNVLAITAAGTYTLDPSTSIVEVAVNAAVTIILPTSISPTAGAQAQPRLFIKNAITVADIGGFAMTHPITIQPKSGAETIMGLTQIQITANYGGWTLIPIGALSKWTAISP